jgi:hypothetical protein
MPLLTRFCLLLLLAAAATPAALAEIRAWKSADGVRSVEGEFVKRDASSVTIRTSKGQSVSIQLSQLHPDERQWLELHHSLSGPGPDPAAVFDTLTFKDTRDSALAKLKASKIVEMTSNETFIGRSGLNGIFSTRQKVGGLSASLYFDWSPGGTLRELTLQTETIALDEYKSRLEPSWRAFIELLSVLYGLPQQKGPMPQAQSLADGSFFPSHLWLLEGNGSALLGTARDGDRYQLVVRFTEKKIQPVELP